MIDPQNPDYSNAPASSHRRTYGYAIADRGAAPAVSLITPFFNTGTIFEETVASVLRQSLQQWEWLIVNDASDDPDSLARLQSHASKDQRIRVLQTRRRQGPAAARNLGVESARAAYVAFVDSDDMLEPTALEKWLWFLQCHGQYAMVKGYQVGFGAEGYLWRDGFHSGRAILERNLVQTASMVRREVYLTVGGMDESIRGGLEDWDFWLRCANAGHWGGTIPEFLDWYRRRQSHNAQWGNWDGGIRQTAFREELRRRYPKLFSTGIPQPELSYPMPYAELPHLPAFENRLVDEPGIRHLLIIVPHLVLGGSDKFTLDLVSELVERHRFRVTVASTLPSTHDWRHRFEALTSDVFTLDTFLGLRDYPRFLAYLIRSRNIDSILVTHSQLGYQLLPYLRALFPKVRCCDYVHIVEPDWKEGGYPAFSITYAPFLDRTGASSEHLKAWMIDRGHNPSKISVVTTNVDAEAWNRDRFDTEALRKKWNAPEGIPLILFAGRLCKQKQPHMLAAVLRALHNRSIEFLCLVAGDGEEGPWLRDFAKRHRLCELRLLGNRTNEEVRELLAVSDIFFLPSQHEGISLALYEAMAMSVVVVAGDVGGQRELVTPECGLLVERGNDEAERYTEALARLLTDTELRQEMGRQARKRVTDQFSLLDMGRQMAGLIRGDENTKLFDLGPAFQAFVPGFAREIIEQRRAEWVAEQLWNQTLTRTPPEVAGSSIRLVPIARLFHSVALLGLLLAGKKHSRNRNLLFTVLRRSRGRRELFDSFDRVFYSRSNPDVPSLGILPLLHYIFHGYREGRRPSPHFDGEGFRSALPEESGTNSNPLLRKIALACRSASGLAN